MVKNLTQIIEEFKEHVQPGELWDVLEAIRTLKRGSGWGKIEMVYLNNDVDTIEISIKRKPKKQKSV